MLFGAPGYLWLLLLLAAVAFMHRRPHVPARGGRAVALLLCRLAAVAALVLALAQPVWQRADTTQTTVFLVDVSASMSDAALERVRTDLHARYEQYVTEGPVKTVAFAAYPRAVADRELDLGQPEALAALRAGVAGAGAPAGSDLADALDFAAALVAPAARGRVVVYSDMRPTTGDVVAAARRLAARGLGLNTHVVDLAVEPEVLIRSVALPTAAAPGATVEATLAIEATEPMPATLTVRRSADAAESEISLSLPGGVQVVRVPIYLESPGLSHYSFALNALRDTHLDNNTAEAALFVNAPPRLVVVEDDAAAPNAAALRTWLGPAAEIAPVRPEQLTDPTALEDVAALVLADVPAAALPEAAQNHIRRAVADRGLGLLVTGGRRSLGPGGYADTPLADCLPVTFSQVVERRDPSTTLVIIIDTSGSMTGARMSLAKEIARLAIARLEPHDNVGIVEFYGSRRWAAPIQPASNAIDITRALNRLSAGGGTVILPAIEEAYYALQNVTTRTRHVLVLTDGGVESGQFEALIRRMADSGITLSTVMVGPGAHSAFLSSLAQWGRGRFYNAPDRFNLPEVILKQPETSPLSPLVEQPAGLRRIRNHPVLDGIDLDDAPALLGYLETTPRPTADVLIASELGHPILVRWDYGLASVAVWTTHLAGDFAAPLTDWPPYATLVANILRNTAAPAGNDSLRVEATTGPPGLTLDVRNLRRRREEAFAALTMTLTDPGGQTHDMVLDPVQPFRYLVHLPRALPGPWRFQAELGLIRHTAAVVVPAPREMPTLTPDAALLAELRAIAAESPPSAPAAAEPWELWPLGVILTLLLVFVDIALRRWPMPLPAARPAVAALLLLTTLAAAAGAQTTAAEPSAAALTPETTALLTKALYTADAAARLAAWETLGDHAAAQYGRLTVLVDALRLRSELHAPELLARTLRREGRLAEAREVLQQASAALPDNGVLAGLWAETLEMTGANEAALTVLNDALAGADMSPDVAQRLRLQAVQLSYDLGQVDAARGHLQALAETAGPFTEPVSLTHAALLRGDHAAALQLLDSTPSLLSPFDDAILKGTCLLALDRPREALAAFEQAYARAAQGRDRRYALERMTAAARAAGALDAFADDLRAVSPLDQDRLRLLLVILREIGRDADALDLLNREDVRALAAHDDDLQRQIIATALEAGRAAAAEEAYRALMQRFPERFEYALGLARLLLLDGRTDEASQLLMDLVEALEGHRPLMRLAEGALELALDDVALAAARRATAYGPDAALSAQLFEADLLRRRGLSDEALAVLDAAAAVAAGEPTRLFRVAETFERFGYQHQALLLYERLYDMTRAEDSLMRITWLLEQAGRLSEAFDHWRQLWRATNNPARLAQARERLLELAARDGRLADFAIELEESLATAAPHQARRRLEMLIDIYTAVNDPVSAAEIIYEYALESGDEVAAAQDLVRVYLRCQQFGRAAQTLRRLIDMDPDKAAEYLQQAAIIALERRQPHQARRALEQLAALDGADTRADEFAAGVFDMIGLHTEAAQRYRRLLAGDPDRIELWLLWGNAQAAAGRAEQAIAAFMDITAADYADDLFAVGVDGLLNLEAPPSALRFALRRTYQRIAQRPDQVFLYHLAGDLLDVLRQPDELMDMLACAVPVAGPRRAPLLRELMETAQHHGRTQRQIDFGVALETLGDQMPPQVFLDLGQTLLRQERYAAAARVFERAVTDEQDRLIVQQRVASYYEQAYLPTYADRIIRELLITQPDNVPLLLRSGNLQEQMDHDALAARQYQRAVDLMLRRLPRRVEDFGARNGESLTRRARAANLDELAAYFQNAANGLLIAATKTDAADAVLAEFHQVALVELAANEADPDPAAALDQLPRLAQLADFLRQTAFACRQPDLADDFDRRLLRVFPEDSDLPGQFVDVRLRWGLYERAAAFLAEGADPPAPVELRVQQALADEAQLRQMLATGSLPAEFALRLTAALIMQDRAAEAAEVLSAEHALPADPHNHCAVMLASGVMLDRPDIVALWRDRWLAALTRQAASRDIAAPARACASLVWPHLDAEERIILVNRLIRLVDQSPAGSRLPLALMIQPLAEAVNVPFNAIDAAPSSGGLEASLSARLFGRTEPAQRPDLLRRHALARAATGRRSWLMQLCGALRLAPDDDFVEVFAELFAAAAPLTPPATNPYTSLTRGGWLSNAAPAPLARIIAETLLAENPGAAWALTAAAVARFNDNAYDEGFFLARDAVDMMLNVPTPDFQTRAMIDDLVVRLAPEEVDTLLLDVDDRLFIDGPTPALYFIQARLSESVGRLDESREALAAAFRAASDSRIITRHLIQGLQAQGRIAELVELLHDHLRGADMSQAYEWRNLTAMNVDLFRPRDALRAAQNDSSPLAPMEFMRIYRFAGRDDLCRVALTQFLISGRTEGRFFTPHWPGEPSPHGLRGYLADAAHARSRRVRLFEALADRPFAAEEYAALVTAAPPDRRDVPGLLDGMAAALQADPEAQASYYRNLLEWRDQGAVNDKDRRLALRLAVADADGRLDALQSVLEPLLIYGDPTDAATLDDLARQHFSRGQPARTRAILRWVLALDFSGGRTGLVSDRCDRWDMFFAALPEDQRGPERLRLLRAWAPTPVDDISDEFEAWRLQRYAENLTPEQAAALLEETLAQLSLRGDAAGYREVKAVLAQLALRADRRPQFLALVREILTPAPLDRYFDATYDVRRILPDEPAGVDLAAALDALAEQVVHLSTAGKISRAQAVRYLCLWGLYSHEQGLAETAGQLLDQALVLAAEPGEHRLWAADLARLLGRETLARAIERELLTERLLPVVRAPALLSAVRPDMAPAAWAELVWSLAAYTDHPEVLRWAAELAADAGQTDRAEAYQQRAREAWLADVSAQISMQ